MIAGEVGEIKTVGGKLVIVGLVVNIGEICCGETKNKRLKIMRKKTITMITTSKLGWGLEVLPIDHPFLA